MQMSSFNIFDHCVYTEVLCEINVHMSSISRQIRVRNLIVVDVESIFNGYISIPVLDYHLRLRDFMRQRHHSI